MLSNVLNRKAILVAAAAFVLAACESGGGSGRGGDGMTSTAGGDGGPNVAAVDRSDVDSGSLGGDYAPGSMEELEALAGTRVFFGYDRYDLSARAQQTLRDQANWMNRYPSAGVTVEGHADERGTREYNLALGARRANAVKRFLVGLGVDGDRIRTISYGKERPEVVGSSESSWAQNRRGRTVVE